jgi:hypothetical protein
LIVNPDHGIERAPLTPLGHVPGGSVGIREVERQQRVGGEVLERAGPLGGADEIDTEAVGGGNEGLGAVRPRREEEQQAGQDYCLPGV